MRDSDRDLIMVDLMTGRPVWYKGRWKHPFYEQNFGAGPMEGVELLDGHDVKFPARVGRRDVASGPSECESGYFADESEYCSDTEVG